MSASGFTARGLSLPSPGHVLSSSLVVLFFFGTAIGFDGAVCSAPAGVAGAVGGSWTVDRGEAPAVVTGDFLRQLEEASLREPMLEYFILSPEAAPMRGVTLNDVSVFAAGEPLSDPALRPATSSLAPAQCAARAPGRLASALCQNALNSKGCRCRLPYTNRPAGRWLSVTLDASEAAEPDERVEHAEGERERERSVVGETLRSDSRGAPTAPGDCPYWCAN
jgi:hypothetical protein